MSFPISQGSYERAQRSLAGGTSSVFRRRQRPTPLYFTEGRGARVKDVDGHELLDFTLAWGPQILGHSHPAVVQAVREQVLRGQTFGAQNELEYVVAEKIISLLRWCDRITYATTGTEAVQVALRLARAHTGRPKILRFAGHYHGWLDSVLCGVSPGDELGKPKAMSAGQVASALEDTLCLPWNDLDAVTRTFAARPGEIAAVILEPYCANGGGILPRPGYLEGLRAICDANGALLIFDEVITGFRIALGGAAEHFGVTPDLAVYGKAVACGFPLSVVAGKGPVMDLIAGGQVFHAGTLNGNPISLAAALATMEVLERDGGAALKEVARLGQMLQAAIREVCAAHDCPVVVQGLGSVFWMYFSKTPIDDDAAFRGYAADGYADFSGRLCERGVLVMPTGRWYLSTAHTTEDVSRAKAAIASALEGARP